MSVAVLLSVLGETLYQSLLESGRVQDDPGETKQKKEMKEGRLLEEAPELSLAEWGVIYVRKKEVIRGSRRAQQFIVNGNQMGASAEGWKSRDQVLEGAGVH